MTGCHPTETLNICIHKRPVKFGCHECLTETVFQKQSNTLENKFESSRPQLTCIIAKAVGIFHSWPILSMAILDSRITNNKEYK